MVTFVDQVTLHIAGGDGGHGCASVHREKFKPLGGPDGGNGGNGGDVVLVVDPQITTLLEFHHSPHRRGGNGKAGAGGHKNGASGAEVELRVPVGTVVTDSRGQLIVDLVAPGTRYVVAQGGRGGLGNAALASTRRRAPGFALLGEPGDALDVQLELKTVADVGLVGFPSAGKSSLIAAISAARPKIADYPFTTLVPNLGVVSIGDTVFTVADVPGLIPGASEGKGLGLEFLRHVERCAVLVHVLDCATLEPGRDPLSDLDAIEHELDAYGGGLNDRPRMVVLNKVDVPEARELAELVTPALKERGFEVFEVSAVSHDGLKPWLYALAEIVKQSRALVAEPVTERIVLRPKAVNETGFTVEFDGEQYIVRGTQPERWVRQTDFSNDEAVGYLADRLARLGVEAQLVKLGAQAGDTIVIGGLDGVIFDFDPDIRAGAEMLMTRRGQDVRFEPSARVRKSRGKPDEELQAIIDSEQLWSDVEKFDSANDDDSA